MMVVLRLTEDQNRALVAVLDVQGASEQEAPVRAIREAEDRRMQSDDVAALSARARESCADLLDRLAR